MDLQSIIILLQMAVSLLVSAQTVPNLPPDFRANAIQVANTAIDTANKAMAVQTIPQVIPSTSLGAYQAWNNATVTDSYTFVPKEEKEVFKFGADIVSGTGIKDAPLYPSVFYSYFAKRSDCTQWAERCSDRQFIYITLSGSMIDKLTFYYTLKGGAEQQMELTGFLPEMTDNILFWGGLAEGEYTYRLVGSKEGYPAQEVTGTFVIKELAV